MIRTDEQDPVGPSAPVVTQYFYQGGAAWRWVDDPVGFPGYQTWSDWRGYQSVLVQTGTAGNVEFTQYLLYRGMDGDPCSHPGIVPCTGSASTKSMTFIDANGNPATDSNQFAGRVRQVQRLNGAQGEVTANHVTPGQTVQRMPARWADGWPVSRAVSVSGWSSPRTSTRLVATRSPMVTASLVRPADQTMLLKIGRHTGAMPCCSEVSLRGRSLIESEPFTGD